MLVYGRQEYQERLGTLLQHLAERAAGTRADSLDDLRTLLIQAGQLEQGIEDFQESGQALDPALAHCIHKLSEQAAKLFLEVWESLQAADGAGPATGSWGLAAFCTGLRVLQGPHPEVLTIKIPEGFEYYALFPEQYCVAALRWAADHAVTSPRQVVVMGIRSIGTSLSALVAAVLAERGWQVRRRNVRPTGHPFAREVRLDTEGIPNMPCAVVVDEGPGLSGSSMAAAARALAKAGVRDISFLPGHGGEPGSAANAETRRWWSETPRFVATLTELRWGGLELSAGLAARSRELENQSGAAAHAHRANGHAGLKEAVQDLSGGLWRQRVFASETHWPAAWTRFERTKYLCSNGDGEPVLWKFAGLGCAWRGGKTSLELAREQTAGRVRSGMVPDTLGSFRGFAASRWVAGTRLGQSDLQDGAVLAHAARYLRESAGEPMHGGEAEDALARLKEMLFANTREALGEAAAEKVRGWTRRIEPNASAKTYGDGRLAPHEWVRTRDGQLLKTDPTGHALDHTLVGKQPRLWDVAGLLVEWGLESRAVVPLLSTLDVAIVPTDMEALRFYEMSYAAFRLGMTTLCAGELPSEDAERKRLETASRVYGMRLEHLVKKLPSR